VSNVLTTNSLVIDHSINFRGLGMVLVRVRILGLGAQLGFSIKTNRLGFALVRVRILGLGAQLGFSIKTNRLGFAS